VGLLVPGEDHERSEDLVRSKSPEGPRGDGAKRRWGGMAQINESSGIVLATASQVRCRQFPFYVGYLPILPLVAKLGSYQSSWLILPHGW